MQVNINVSEEFLPEIDANAKKFHISRSAFISMCVAQQIRANNVSDSLPELMQAVNLIKDKLDFENLDLSVLKKIDC